MINHNNGDKKPPRLTPEGNTDRMFDFFLEVADGKRVPTYLLASPWTIYYSRTANNDGSCGTRMLLSDPDPRKERSLFVDSTPNGVSGGHTIRVQAAYSEDEWTDITLNEFGLLAMLQIATGESGEPVLTLYAQNGPDSTPEAYDAAFRALREIATATLLETHSPAEMPN